MEKPAAVTTRVVTVTFTGTDDAFAGNWIDMLGDTNDLTEAEALALLVERHLTGRVPAGKSGLVLDRLARSNVTWAVTPPRPTP